jgi:hypothetical protein
VPAADIGILVFLSHALLPVSSDHYQRATAIDGEFAELVPPARPRNGAHRRIGT